MIEKIIAFSIERRGLMLLLAVVIIVVGSWQTQSLSVDVMPDITNVQVQINSTAAGFTPQEVEQQITYPIEQMLMGLPDVSYFRSLSRYGLSQVTVIFDEGTDFYHARNLITNRLSSLKSVLPEQIEPMLGPIATGLSEIFMYSISADPDARQPNGQPYDQMALRDIQDWVIKPQLSLVKGVTEINTIGGDGRQFHITPDPQKLFFHQVSFDEIVHAVENNNRNQGAGYVETNGEQVLVRIPGQLNGIDDLANVVVKTNGDHPIFISQVADVIYGKELRIGAGMHNGQQAVIGTAMMLVGENARTVSEQLTQRAEQIQRSLPQGVALKVLYNRTDLVDKVIATVEKNLMEGALLVIVVLFLLLGNLRAALITALVIPLSMLITVTGMVQASISANLMSLGALDFGLIVDGAVIIVENAIRHLGIAQKAQGQLSLQQRLQVVYQSVTEVIHPSLFGVLIITLVYIPIFSLSGVEGKLFHPMAITVIMALTAAMFLCLTIVPALVAICVTGKVSEKENRLIELLQSAYIPLLKWALAWRGLVVLLAITFVVMAMLRAPHLGTEFIPQLDEGDIALHAMRVPGTSLSQAVSMQSMLETEILKFDEVAHVFSKIGTAEVATDPMPPHVADTFIMLKPRELWPEPSLSKAYLLTRIETQLALLPGNNYEFTQPIQMRFNELISGIRADLGVKIYGENMEQLKTTAAQVLQILQSTDGVADARIEQVDDLPVVTFEPDRSDLARHGLTVADIQRLIATAVSGQDAGLIYQGDKRYPIKVVLAETQRQRLDNLNDFPIHVGDNKYMPLSELAGQTIRFTPNQISRENARRMLVVSANVRGRDLGSFVEEVQEKVNTDIDVPTGMWIDYGGTFEQLESANQRLIILVPLVLVMVLSLLTLVLKSFKDALMIFSGVPLAMSGGVFALAFRDMPFSISAAIGFIALSGIAVLNGMVMLTFIREQLTKTNQLYHAIVDGASLRLRPVLMTALVASLGFVPMALNMGIGTEVQKPLATVVIGGIMSSTLLTLFVLPVLFAIANRIKTPN